MIVALWILLLVASVVVEVAAHRPGARVTPLELVAARLWCRPVGRIVLLGIWAWVGVHLFCRYTIPA